MWGGLLTDVSMTRKKKTGVVPPNHSTPKASQHLKREFHIPEGCQSIHRLEMYAQMSVATADSYKAHIVFTTGLASVPQS